MAVKGPLTGYKVLDLTQFESGTVCTETLAWLGAEVYKVERPVSGELGRYSVANPGKDTVGFILLNMNKKSITCNMKTPEGKQLIQELIPKVDVFVENMGTGSIDRLGFSYEAVKAMNPKIVYAQIKGFGMDGPFADYPAFNPIAQAVGGAAALTGMPGDVPCQPGPDMADSGAGYMCALSIIAALLQAERTGEGQRIEVAMSDVVTCFCRAAWEPYYDNGRVPPRRVGNGMPLEDVGPAGLYPCKPFGPNDYVHVYCSRHPGSKQFDNLCKIIGREELLADERFATPRSRYQYRDVLDPIISEWTSRYTKQEAMDILCKADIPTGAIYDCNDITNDEYLRRRGTMVELKDTDQGNIIVPGFAPKMSGVELEYEKSPALGGSNEEVYGKLLGHSAEELAAFKKARAI